MPNRLGRESSAYLLQHRDNPVDWYAWGEEPWERARRERKPVLVSIGYSSCHWCHVMEHESFEDEATARLMNEHLVCIKVDREERPDVDQIYMAAVMRMTGQGGWPLNMFCTPDGRPFHGGTYFPPQPAHGRPSWSDVVRAVARAFAEQPSEVEEQAERVMETLRATPQLEGEPAPGRAVLRQLCGQLMAGADSSYGGFGGAPKFPTPTNLEAVLLAESLGVAPLGALDHVVFTLKRMARGGIYDQLAGGFHRYSTDERWLVPHFEKMLYDNGQLLRVYAEAFRQTRDPELRWPVEETVDWLESEMRAPEGGFYASQDADSEGEEGRYFVWSPAELGDALGPEEGRAFADAYGVSAGGNFERTGKSVLSHVLAGERPVFADARARLLAVRRERVAPDTDRKNVCSWIGYTIGGLATAASVFGREDWLEAAERAADFALARLSDGGANLLRVFSSGEARIEAFLDDHAALLCGLLDLSSAGGDAAYVDAAVRLAEAIRDRFFDPAAGDLFFSAGSDSTLPLRPATDSDGATPAALGLAVLGLVRLASLTGRADLDEVAQSVLATHAALATRAPLHLPTLVRAAALADAGPGVALVLGEDSDPRSRALAARARAVLGPEDAVVVASTPPDWLAAEGLRERAPAGDEPTAYVCRGRVCSLPTSDPERLEAPEPAPSVEA